MGARGALSRQASRRRRSRAQAMPRWTLDPAVLLKLGEMILEAPVVELCLFGLTVLRNRPCLRICLRLRLRLCLRLRLGLRLRLWLRLWLLWLWLSLNLR